MGDQDFHPLSSLARFEPLPPRAPASTSVHKISSGRRFPTIHLNRVHGVNCDCQILENLFPDICPRLFTCLFLILCIRDFFLSIFFKPFSFVTFTFPLLHVFSSSVRRFSVIQYNANGLILYYISRFFLFFVSS